MRTPSVLGSGGGAARYRRVLRGESGLSELVTAGSAATANCTGRRRSSRSARRTAPCRRQAKTNRPSGRRSKAGASPRPTGTSGTSSPGRHPACAAVVHKHGRSQRNGIRREAFTSTLANRQRTLRIGKQEASKHPQKVTPVKRNSYVQSCLAPSVRPCGWNVVTSDVAGVCRTTISLPLTPGKI